MLVPRGRAVVGVECLRVGVSAGVLSFVVEARRIGDGDRVVGVAIG